MWKETFLITLLFVLSTDPAQAIDARSAEAPITDKPSAEGGTVRNEDEGEILIYTKNDIFRCVLIIISCIFDANTIIVSNSLTVKCDDTDYIGI